jgi:hypothetical protein
MLGDPQGGGRPVEDRAVNSEPDPQLAPYARLLELARLAEALVADDRHTELDGVWAERDAIVARLPARPPADARPLLLETSRAVRATELLLRTGLDASRRSLQALGTGRRAAAGYGGAVVPTLLDASA